MAFSHGLTLLLCTAFAVAASEGQSTVSVVLVGSTGNLAQHVHAMPALAFAIFGAACDLQKLEAS